MKMRLNKYLAKSGYASRRKCDKFIESGKVIINGKVVKDFSYRVNSEDIIICDGLPLSEMPKNRVYLINKLKGYISTSSDPEGRKKVIDLIKTDVRLFTVGRLDRDTTGAILATNNGQLANELTHPKNQIEKVYIVSTKIDILKENYRKLSNGIQLEGKTKAYGKIKRLGRKAGLIHWKVTLCEGKNHEVKRIFKALDSRVIHLHRDSFAGLKVEKLPLGKYRELKMNEIKLLLKSNNILDKY